MRRAVLNLMGVMTVSVTAAIAAPAQGAALRTAELGDKGQLTISYSWQARIVAPGEFKDLTVYDRKTKMECPLEAGDISPTSYFALIDSGGAPPKNPESDGAYQSWWNEGCKGSITLNDMSQLDDPTISGLEPVVRSTGTRAFESQEPHAIVETDLSRGRTRYMFITPSAEGFREEADDGRPAKLVPATAAPGGTYDFTLEGPISSGRGEVPVRGGMLVIEWAFARGR